MSKRKNGTAAADKIVVSESSLIVRAGKGNDIITVKKGHINEIHGDAGNDKITVNKTIGKNNEIYGDSGKDQIIINGGTKNKYFGGSGNDIIKFAGGKSNIIHGDAGNDSITITKTVGASNKIYGDAGVDTITIQGGSSNTIVGGASGDKITLSGGSKNKIYGDDEKLKVSAVDKFTIKGGSSNTVYGGKGKDQFTISGGTYNKIYGGSDRDTFTLKGGNNLIDGEAGDDVITVNGGNNRTKWVDVVDTARSTDTQTYLKRKESYAGGIYGGSGNDTITVNKGSHFVHGGSGNDTIYVYSSNNKITGKEDATSLTRIFGGIVGGKGNDHIIVKNANNNDIFGGIGNLRRKVDNEKETDNDGTNIIEVTNGNNNYIHGGNGSDTITLIGGKNNYVDNDYHFDLNSNSIDKIKIENNTESRIYGSVNSIINVLGGQKNDILIEGNSKVYVDGGSGHEITDAGYNGNTTIEVKNANNVTFYYSNVYVQDYNPDNQYQHSTQATFSGGNGHVIDLLSGSNGKISLTGGSGHSINMGGENNNIKVTWNNSLGRLNIYEGTNGWGMNNILDFSNVKSTVFDFKEEGSNLVLASTTGNGSIVINDWVTSYYDSFTIKFSDQSFNYDKLEQKLGHFDEY